MRALPCLLLSIVLASPVLAQARPAVNGQAAAQAHTQPGELGMAGSPASDPAAEGRFVQAAANAAAGDMALGDLAARRASSAQVLMFGRWLRADADASLHQLIQATDHPPHGQPHLPAKLAGLSGRAFDHAVMDAAHRAARDAETLMRHEAQTGRDQRLVFYAQRQMPIMQAHAEEAENLGKRAPGGSEATPDPDVEHDTELRLQQQETAHLRH